MEDTAAPTLAQEYNTASPCPSASTGADSLIRFLVAEHTGVVIVKIDLTRIGPVSQTSRSEATRLDQRR